MTTPRTAACPMCSGPATTTPQKYGPPKWTAIEAQAAPPDALREALLAVEWYANGDNTEAFCITCNADRPGPHKPDCIVGAALAAAPTAHIGSDIMRSPIVHPEDYGYQDAPTSGLREALVKVLIEHAVDGFENQGLHGWRCQYPDSYGGGPCSCFADLVDSLVIVISAAYEEEK